VFILSQVFATQVNNIEHLWMTSALLGLGYGGTFGLFPTIVIEWFGLSECARLIRLKHCRIEQCSSLGHFSENWGYVSMAPMVGGNLFSLAFGSNLDKHAAHKPDTPHGALFRRAGLPSTEQCFEGRDCYVSSLYLTIVACSLSLAISIFAARRDKKRMIVTEVPPEDEGAEVLWEGRE
jgi:MFS family permease